MKIQGSKSDSAQHAVSKESDAMGSSSSSVDNFFAEMIATILTQGMEQTNDQDPDEQSSNNDLNQEDKNGMPSQPGISLPFSNQQSMVGNATSMQVLADTSPNEKPTDALSNKMSAMLAYRAEADGRATSADSMSQLSNKLDEMPHALDQEGEQGFLRTENQLAITLNSIMKNTAKQNESTDALAYSQLDESAIKKIASDINESRIDTSVDTSTQLFNSQKSQINLSANQLDQPIAAFAQLGNLIVPQLAMPLVDNKQTYPSIQNVEGQAASKASLQQPEYELKIDVFNTSSEPLAKNVYNASIKIYPPELGTILAKLKLDGNSAELHILTDNNRIKEVVEANINQLRHHFRDADINLTSIQIDVQSSQQDTDRKGSTHQQAQESHLFEEKNSSKTNQSKSTISKSSDSLIDTYA